MTTVWGRYSVNPDDIGPCVDRERRHHSQRRAFSRPLRRIIRSSRTPSTSAARKNILDAMKRMEKPPVIVFASSLSVCGPRVPGGPPLTSSRSLPIGTDNYTSNKAECERLLAGVGSYRMSSFRIGVSVGVKVCGRRSFARRLSYVLFGINPDTRLEWVHPKDVALAQVSGDRNPCCSWRRYLMIGGGRRMPPDVPRVLRRDVRRDRRWERFPPEAYGTGQYYCDWLDTDESQALLGYQRTTFDAFIGQLREASRFTRPLARMFSPLIRWFMLRYSDAWQARKSRV